MTHTPIIQLVPQRHPMDCGIASLASFLNLSYEDVLVNANPDVMTQGMTWRQIRDTAKRLGFTLKFKRQIDLEEDSGLLAVGAKQWKGFDHLVVLVEGRIYDDLCVWEADAFLAHYQATALNLLTLA